MNKPVRLSDILRDKASTFMDGSPRSERILEVFDCIDRKAFLPADARSLALVDESVSVGYNQTNSQPGMLAFMFDKLDIRDGDRILEIGTGVGYAAALAAGLCGEDGQVITLEIIPELAEQARRNLAAFSSITVIAGDGSCGCAQYAPFDKIFFSAGTGPGFDHLPLLSQLAQNGRLMFPRRFGELFLYTRIGDEFTDKRFYSVSFVRLQGRNSGW